MKPMNLVVAHHAAGFPLPVEAECVIAILRRDVPRPPDSPGETESIEERNFIVRRIPRLRFMRGGKFFCPMGLHPLSTSEAPGVREDFAGGACETVAVRAFARWWDLLPQKDANAAMDLIWPPE